MRVNAASSNAASCASCPSHGSGRVNQRRNELQAGLNDRFDALRSEFHDARRAAAGDPAKLAEVHAQFKEQKAALKTEAEAVRNQFRDRVEDRFGDDDAAGPADVADPVVAASPDLESGNGLDVVA